MMTRVNTNVICRRVLCAAIVSCLVLLCGLVDVSRGQQRPTRGTVNRLAQQGNTDAAATLFRSGRDLITDQEWAKAQAKFEQLISGYPNDKNLDAALYWTAYAQNKLSQIDQCRQTIKRLLEKYPNTAWKEDAKILLAQTLGTTPQAYVVGTSENGFPTVRAVDAGVAYAPAIPAPVAVAQTLGNAAVWGIEPSTNVADDDPCEFKIVVLQALFQTDVQRGIVAATEWLKPGSTQTVRCKGAALTLLGRNGGKAVTPVILGVAKNEPDLKLRARAISALGATNDDSVVDALRDFALNSSENDIVEASLYALSKHTGERAIVVLGEIASSTAKPNSVRRVAISSISTRPGEPAVDALLRIYDNDQTIEIRRAVISGLGNRKSERAGAKLLDIARGSDVIELRKGAISAISRRGGDKVIDTLLSLYDTEKNEELKDQIMNSLGTGTVIYSSAGAGGTTITPAPSTSRVSRFNDQRVIRKFIEIARDPKTPMERRKRAIGWLSRSNDPEVLKFLEELLK
jgi:tetratricopeptide (TPR) repeat protein